MSPQDNETDINKRQDDDDAKITPPEYNEETTESPKHDRQDPDRISLPGGD